MPNRARFPIFAFLCLFLISTTAILASNSRGDVDVTANGNNTFTPENVIILAGQSVNWTNDAGFHNVVADDNSFTSGAPSSDPWMFSQQFDTPGSYGYYCSVHGSAGGNGMSGVVTVLEPAIYLPIVTAP